MWQDAAGWRSDRDLFATSLSVLQGDDMAVRKRGDSLSQRGVEDMSLSMSPRGVEDMSLSVSQGTSSMFGMAVLLHPHGK